MAIVGWNDDDSNTTHTVTQIARLVHSFELYTDYAIS